MLILGVQVLPERGAAHDPVPTYALSIARVNSAGRLLAQRQRNHELVELMGLER